MALEMTPTHDERFRLAGSKVPQFLATFFATLSALAAGASIAWSSPVLPLLEKDHIVTVDQATWVTSLITLGGCFGSVPAGWLANRIGRKTLLVLSTIPMLSSWLLICFSNDLWDLYVGRILSGLSVGVVSVAAPMYISEISEDCVRGQFGTYFQLQLTVGVLFVYIVGLVQNALYISLVCLALPVLFICTFIWMPESPSHLLSKGKEKAAADALQWLRGTHYNIEPEMNVLRDAVAHSLAYRSSMLDVFRDRGSARALLISLGLMGFQQLSAVNAVIFYSQHIFRAVGNSVDPVVSSIIIGGVQVLATYSSTVLIERAGRRRLLLLSASSMSICLAIVGLYFFLHAQFTALPTSIPLVFLALFIFGFSVGFGPVPWVVVGELFSDHLKGVASALATSLNWGSAFGVVYMFNILAINVGYGVTFFIFSAFCIAGALFVATLLPETKGKDCVTIQEELRGEQTKRLSKHSICRVFID